MKKIVVCVLMASICRIGFAEKSPVVGLWERLIAGDRGDGSPVNAQRVDVVFVDKRIDDDTRFSGLFAADIKPEILCCLNIKKSNIITLPDLLRRYPWDADTENHIKKITGWAYIYEASIVDASEQNARMRNLLKSLSVPPTLSPYSAPVISGKIQAAEISKKFRVDNSDVAYAIRVSEDKSTISYKFSINEKSVTLTEEMFPAE